MLRMIKYLKKQIIPIIIIVLLLMVQSICDLSLPDYTAKIVNTGIQQQGVEGCVPDIIRTSSLLELDTFMTDNDRLIIDQNYTTLDSNNLSSDYSDSYVKKYPALADQPLLKLNDKLNAQTRDQLNEIFGRCYLATSMLKSDDPQVSAIKQQLVSSMPSDQQQILSQSNLFDILKTLPDANKRQVVQKINEQINEMPSLLVTQAATASVKQEYKDIGIDLNDMQMKYLFSSGIKMLILALVSVTTSIFVVMLASKVGAYLGRELRCKTYSKVMDFSGQEIGEFSTASLITRTTNDIQQIQLIMVMLLRIVFYAPIIGIGGILKVHESQSDLLWVLGLAIMSIAFTVLLLFVFVIPKFKKMQKLIDKINLIMREILTGLPVIRAFSTQEHEQNRFAEINNKLTKTNIFVNRMMGCLMPIMYFIMNSSAVLIVWVGAGDIQNGGMQVGNMMAVIQYSMQIIMAFLMICMISVMIPRASVAAKRVDAVLQTPISIKDPVMPTPFIKTQRGVVSFENVSFKYPGAEQNVLSDITFTALPGQTTAIIGSTGSGKSTLINLIPRFYDVTEGQIAVDGVDIKRVLLHDLRNKIGYVPQKGFLFSGDIKSNISYGKETSKEMLELAANVSQSRDFIYEKPEAYSYEISQGGTNVSGGQRQRLSIARAIASNPDIYIFDDSFSALDYKTDNRLRQDLKKITLASTVIIVAQRISTIMQAEKIIVLDEGKIVGIGDHTTLLHSCEIYREIAKSQLSKEEF